MTTHRSGLMKRLANARVTVVALVLVAIVAALATAFALARDADPTPTIAFGPPRFVDVTASAGIDHTYNGDVSSYAVGGGVAVFDCNGDGKPDLYLAGGSSPAALYRNDSPVGGPLQFTKLPNPTTDVDAVLGAYPIRLSGDGQVDLVLLREGESFVLRGLGDCRFERGQTLPGSEHAMTTAFSARWDGSAKLPTLALGHYLQLDPAGKPTYDCDTNTLLRPNADNTTYAPPVTLAPGYCTLSVLFSDWDRSGRRDLRVTNDRQYYVNGQDQLWRLASGEPPRQYTDADGWVSLQIWGMGIASFDVTGRGFPDVFLTSQGDNKLQTLTVGPGQPTYRDIALRRGVNSARPFTGGDVRPSTAWHPEFQDVNNDGFIDLFVSKGNVSSMPEYASRDPNDLFLGQPDGTFVEAADAAGILNYARGRGAALADFSLDGSVDLVEVNYGEPVRLWRNVGSGDLDRPVGMGNWLEVRLHQPDANSDAIGAWLEVQIGKATTRRELAIGGGHAGGQLGWTHFGLGAARDAQIRVQWPDGEVGPWLRVSADQFAVIEREGDQVVRWRP